MADITWIINGEDISQALNCLKRLNANQDATHGIDATATKNYIEIVNVFGSIRCMLRNIGLTDEQVRNEMEIFLTALKQCVPAETNSDTLPLIASVTASDDTDLSIFGIRCTIGGLLQNRGGECVWARQWKYGLPVE